MMLAVLGMMAGAAVVEVRATRETAPCVAAAMAASSRWRGARMQVGAPREPGPADVVVASEVELTRALESGSAQANSDVDLARIPWVWRGPAAAAASAGSLSSARPVALPDGPASYEARRALRQAGSAIVETADVAALKEAPLALVPLSLADDGPRIAVTTVPPIIARAALGSDPRHPDDARAFLQYLASEDGQRAFAACSNSATNGK